MSVVYNILKRVFGYSIYQYFSDVQVLNQDLIPKGKPLIFTPNHRSAFMDPLVVGCLLPNEMNFLARGESFHNPTMARIFSHLNMIPIYRKEYSPNQVHKNDEIFRHCYDLLARNGSLMIFPEGLCQTKFILAPLKTGTARIALGAAEKHNLDVHIVPVGINYTHPHIFRSRLVLDIGESIRVKSYLNNYRKENEQTVRDLTAEIDKRLREKIVILNDSADDVLLRQMEQLYASDPDSAKSSWYEQRQFIASGIDYFRKHREADLNAFTEKLQAHLRKYAVVYPESKLGTDVKAQLAIKGGVWKGIILLLTLPLFIIGCATHLIPFLLTKVLAKRIVKRSDFAGSVILALGVLIFSAFLILESYQLHQFISNWLITIAFILIWPSLGLFTYLYGVTANVFIRKLVLFFNTRLQSKKAHLKAEREELITELRSAAKEFASSQAGSA